MYIEDEEFIRGSSPMTKEEIRILSIAKLNIESDSKVLDIGAGTGSVSIQIARMCPEGSVTAIEKNPDAVELIYKNREKFKIHNLSVVSGEAIEVAPEIGPWFSGIFVGGSGGNIDSIIKTYGQKLKIKGRMVLNFITLKNLSKTIELFDSMNYNVNCIQVSINRIKGKSCMISSNNSIFIVTAVKLS